MAFREEKRNEKNPDQKRSKTLTVSDGMILYIENQYIENQQETIRKLFGLISEFSKVMEYKVNKYKSTGLLYTMKNQKEKFKSQSHSPLQQQQQNKIRRNKPT